MTGVKEQSSREHGVLLEQVDVLSRMCNRCGMLFNVRDFMQVDQELGCRTGHVRELFAEDEFETLDCCRGELFANVATRVARCGGVGTTFEWIVYHSLQLFVCGAGECEVGHFLISKSHVVQHAARLIGSGHCKLTEFKATPLGA